MAKNNPFDQVAVTAPNYSTFDLSHDHKTSMQMGRLVPVFVAETLPGDSWKIHSEAMFRLMPMIAPIMHKVSVRFEAFYVPNRILWDNWEKFITGGEVGQSVGVPPAAPYLTLNDVEPSSLANYLGLPANNGVVDMSDMQVSALPFAAYQRIWWEYYRDQNLIDPGDDPFMLTDGLQDATNTNNCIPLRNRAWEHDYFTSCLPTAQKGTAVELPIEFADIPVKWRIQGNAPGLWRSAATGNLVAGTPDYVGINGLGQADSRSIGGGGITNAAIQYDPNGTQFVDGDDLATTTTINDLRTAWALQQWLEKNMRAGSRYKEALLAHFNVRSSDARLQRPQYIGGARGTIAVSEVLQTSSTDTETPQANMAGHGISVMGTGGMYYKCEEHGYIMVMVSILPTTAYYHGVPRHFFKFDRMMYAWPDFAQLGEQEVYNKELYYDESDGENENVFGYIPRYSEYRYHPSRVSGQMATTLQHWHMGRRFADRPNLNADFIQSNPTKDIFAVTDADEDDIVCQIFSQIIARRPLPVYGIPAPLV